jgi:tetratricopeptide (TPR) repeat protein
VDIEDSAQRGKQASERFLISYVKADEPWADWVAWTLEGAGHSVWHRTWDDVPGSRPVANIQRTLTEGRRVVVVLSAAYMASPGNHVTEWQAAWAADPDGVARGLLVVRVENFDPVGLLGNIASVDLFGLDTSDAQAVLLEAAMGRRLKPAGEPSFPGTQSRAGQGRGAALPSEIPSVWNVQAPVARFIGRDDLLIAIHDGLSTPERAGAFTLWGLGGVGKTALALEYLHSHAREFDVVWWIDATDSALVGAQVAALGFALGLPAGSDWTAVSAALHAQGRRWMLVLDNVTQPELIGQFRPSNAQGRLLATSRIRGLDGFGAATEVREFSPDEAVDVLVRRVGHITETEARSVADLLGHLPLAMEQAASYLVQTGIPPARYVRLLIERLGSMLDRGWVADRPKVTIRELWDLSIAEIRAERPAAAALLELCAFCARSPVPLDLFTSDSAPLALVDEALLQATEDELDWEETVGILVAYSLARRAQSALTVHVLTAAAVRENLAPPARADRTSETIRLLASGLPSGPGEPANWPRWRQLLPHVRTALNAVGDEWDLTLNGLVSRLCDETGKFLNSQGQASPAVAYLRRALLLDETRLGPTHPDTVVARNNLAAACLTAGLAGEAADLLEQAIGEAARRLGTDHPDTWMLRGNLASAYWRCGRIDEAIGIFESVAPRYEVVLGPGHRETLITRYNLALAYRAAGRWDESRGMLGWALADAEHHLGRHDPVTVRIRGGLADGVAMDWSPEGLRLRQMVVNESEETFGLDHPETLTARNNLAAAYLENGRIDDARTALEQVLADHVRVLGVDHPSTHAVRQNLDYIYNLISVNADTVVRLEEPE